MYEPLTVGEADSQFEQAISEQIWATKYRYVRAGETRDHSIGDTWQRVARALTIFESETIRATTENQFRDAMASLALLPAGRIISGAGTERDITLSNTFVMRRIPDSLDGIMQTVTEAARTMKMGGGLGFDFSTLRPKGSPVAGLDCPAAGPLAAMDICDAVCKMVVSGMGVR